MSSNNPDITASDIITDVENRLDTPGISTSVYLPWVSYAYQKTYQAITYAGQRAKETFFGAYIEVDLTNGTAEYTISDIVPRFGGIIKVEIKYGNSEDVWNRAKELPSISDWKIQNNVDTTYRSKTCPLYYVLKDTIGFIPTPPSTDTSNATARIWYVQRPYQITSGSDVVDLPYRFIYPVNDYVQAKAIMKENEDYAQAAQVEANFRLQLDQITALVENEFNENEGRFVKIDSSDSLYANPQRR